MAEVVLGFVYRASTNGLGGVYLEAAFAGASGLVALGAKTISKLRKGTEEPADVSGSPVDARSANATVQGDAGDRAVLHPASADGLTTSQPVQSSAGDSTSLRRLPVQPPLPTLDPSLSYAKFNDTKLNTNIFYIQHDPIDPTSASTTLCHNFTIPAECVVRNDSSITTYTDLSPPRDEAHKAPSPPSNSPSKRSVRDSALRAATATNEEGDAHEDEDANHGDSDEDIDSGAGAQGRDVDVPVAGDDAPVGEDDVRRDGVDAHVDYADAQNESVDAHGNETNAWDAAFAAQMDGKSKAEVGVDEVYVMHGTGVDLDAPVAAAEGIEIDKARIPQPAPELFKTPSLTPRVPTNIAPRSKPTNDVDADDAAEPPLPVLARIKAWEQGRRTAAHEDDVQAGADTVNRGGDLLASPALTDDVDDEEELPPAPVVERIKAWEQARTVARRASGRKSAGRADDVRAGAEITKGGDNQRGASAPTGNDDVGARSPALSDNGTNADADDADEQSPPIETGMRSVASLKRLYEPFRFRLADSATDTMNAKLKTDILTALLKDYAAGGIIPDDFPGVSTLQAHSDNPRNRACAIARGQEIARSASLNAIYANGMHMDGPLTTFLFDTLNSPQFLANMVGPILRRAPVEIPVPEAPAQGGMEDGKSDLLHLLLGLAFIENRDTAPLVAREIFEPAINKAMNIYDARVKFFAQPGLQMEDTVDSEYDALVGSLFDMCLAARQQPAEEVVAPPRQELWHLYKRPANANDAPPPSKPEKQSVKAFTSVTAASATVADASDAANASRNAEVPVSALSDDDLDAPGDLAAPEELSGASGSLSATSLDLKRKQSEAGDEGEEEAVEEYLRLKRARELTQ
ncbi:hypothetical protein K525DRAFT_251974 [Schizophyllum commune Loenen D]|nr:hypothetical protein K525DRAFT_251974 [Schizophyllum commune Loenen D]